MKHHHKRRRRRQQNMALRSGGKFRINHRSPSGRTGRVRAKNLGRA